MRGVGTGNLPRRLDDENEGFESVRVSNSGKSEGCWDQQLTPPT